jgi:hypothetical protein
MRRLITSSLVLCALALPAAAASGAPKGDLTISADPDTIVYKQATTVAGTLKTSPLKTGVLVRLQENPAPFSGGFKNVGTAMTGANGDYSFTGVAPLLNTRYRAVTVAPKTESAEILVQVRVKVVLRLSDRTPRRGQRVRFYGTAAPEHDGRIVYVQRRSSTGKWRSVATTPLQDAGTELSKFSKRIRVRRDGTYRARVFHDSDHADGTSRRKRALVH